MLLSIRTTKVLLSICVLLIATLLIGLILLTHVRMLRLLWWWIHLRLQSVNSAISKLHDKCQLTPC